MTTRIVPVVTAVLLASLLVVSGVSMTMPGQRQPITVRPPVVSTGAADAGVKAKPTVAGRREDLRTKCDQLAALLSKDRKAEIRVTSIYWATQNFNDDQDLAVVNFSEGKLSFALVLVFSAGEWQLLPDTLRP